MIAPNNIKHPWRQLARTQSSAPGTADLVTQLSSEISQSFTRFGPKILRRVPDSVYFAVTTFPPELRLQYAWGQGYLIAWVFALDNLLDECHSYRTALELETLLNALLSTPPDSPSNYVDLPFSAEFTDIIPEVGYSIFDVIAALQPLRCRLYQQASDVAGPQFFERYLQDKVIAMMLRETAWRLGELPQPSFDQYLDTATTTICGGLCVATLNAVLPAPTANWQAIDDAVVTMCRAVRLVNDLATWTKDEAEGTPNAVNILTTSMNNRIQAELAVRRMVDEAALRLHSLCAPLLRQQVESPLYALGFYTYYSWVMTEAMYAKGDFTAEEGLDDGNNLPQGSTKGIWRTNIG